MAEIPESEAMKRWNAGDYNIAALPEMFVSSMAAHLPAWASPDISYPV